MSCRSCYFAFKSEFLSMYTCLYEADAFISSFLTICTHGFWVFFFFSWDQRDNVENVMPLCFKVFLLLWVTRVLCFSFNLHIFNFPFFVLKPLSSWRQWVSSACIWKETGLVMSKQTELAPSLCIHLFPKWNSLPWFNILLILIA